MLCGDLVMAKRDVITVDLESLPSLDHACDGCRGKEAAKSCCATYEVCISHKEMEAIVGVLPEISKTCPQLKDGDEFQNVFEETDDGFLSLDTTEDGLCVFAYQIDQEVRCGVHSAALRLNLPIEDVKPAVCILWPLSVSEDAPQRLSIADDALDFHCNTACDRGSGSIPDIFVETLTQVYGKDASAHIVNAANAGRPRTTISPTVSRPRERERGTRPKKTATRGK